MNIWWRSQTRSGREQKSPPYYSLVFTKEYLDRWEEHIGSRARAVLALPLHHAGFDPAVRYLGRLVNVIEPIRAALNEVAQADPHWFAPLVTPEWAERYSRRASEYKRPKGQEAQAGMTSLVGADGGRLLKAGDAADARPTLRHLPQVQVLRQVWRQQFSAPDENGVVCYCATEDVPPGSLLISAPYDVEARNASKREERWAGYKVHLTETCDAAAPQRITMSRPLLRPPQKSMQCSIADNFRPVASQRQ